MKQLEKSLGELFGGTRRARATVALIEEQRKSRNAMATARRLAAKHAIDIERDRDGYWVTCAKLDDAGRDPIDGNHFCVGGAEVLEAVEVYVTAIEGAA